MTSTHAIALSLFTVSLATPAIADINFAQTVDGWFENKFTWNAQNNTITCKHSLDPIGAIRSTWIRVVQKNGSQAGTAVICTTMTKIANGITDDWRVAVPAGTICDGDFWDADVLCVEVVQCGRASRLAYNSVPHPSMFGRVAMIDLPGGELDIDPDRRYMALDPIGFDTFAVINAGFDMAVYAYGDPQLGPPQILNHLDPFALSTFTYDQNDAFGTGLPFQPEHFVILGIDLDQSWDFMPKISTGLNDFNWQLDPFGSGLLQTDQGDFNIIGVQPLFQGWEFICPADYNGDGSLNFLDVSEFLNLFASQDPAADFNGDGNFNFLDISAFLESYGEGCP
ncbi:MAG: GC-type dockerin domain-anchored protein [Phycisphaerales bacterium]|nr:GC-type dockerin domain-anchored protein [Phycisphaerales bacterium]